MCVMMTTSMRKWNTNARNDWHVTVELDLLIVREIAHATFMCWANLPGTKVLPSSPIQNQTTELYRLIDL